MTAADADPPAASKWSWRRVQMNLFERVRVPLIGQAHRHPVAGTDVPDETGVIREFAHGESPGLFGMLVERALSAVGAGS